MLRKSWVSKLCLARSCMCTCTCNIPVGLLLSCLPCTVHLAHLTVFFWLLPFEWAKYTFQVNQSLPRNRTQNTDRLYMYLCLPIWMACFSNQITTVPHLTCIPHSGHTYIVHSAPTIWFEHTLSDDDTPQRFDNRYPIWKLQLCKTGLSYAYTCTMIRWGEGDKQLHYCACLNITWCATLQMSMWAKKSRLCRHSRVSKE